MSSIFYKPKPIPYNRFSALESLIFFIYSPVILFTIKKKCFRKITNDGWQPPIPAYRERWMANIAKKQLIYFK